MVLIPSAVIFVNTDLTDSVQSMLTKQLRVDYVMTGSQFDQSLITDPEYVNKIKQLNLRVLVKRDLDELQNREYADIVAFIKAGLISVLENNFGPPGITFPIVNLTWGKLGVFSCH